MYDWKIQDIGKSAKIMLFAKPSKKILPRSPSPHHKSPVNGCF
jgi:hypothetical protein